MSLRIKPSAIAGHVHRRSESRARVPMEAKVDTMHGRDSAFILNLSCNGAMVQSQELPPARASVILRCGPLDVLGTVVWAEHERFGIQFDEPIPEEIVVGMRRKAEEAARHALHSDRRAPLAAAPMSATQWTTAQEWAVSNGWR